MTANSLLPYDGTAGYVNRPASIERARDEAASGVASARARVLLDAVKCQGARGMTWRELQSVFTNLHHGQISGALSVLHKTGHVFAVREKRGKCHPYVASIHRGAYRSEQVFDQPVKTKSAQQIADMHSAIEQAIHALSVAVNSTEDKDELITVAIDALAPYYR